MLMKSIQVRVKKTSSMIEALSREVSNAVTVYCNDLV